MVGEPAAEAPVGWLRASKPWLWAAAGAAALAIGLALLPILSRTAIAAGDLMQLVAAATAAVACLAQSRRRDTPRTGWLLLGLGAAAWAAGQVAWTWYEAVRGIQVPIPSLSDLGFLAMVPLALAGLLRLAPLPKGIHTPAALLLDGVLSALAVFVLAWPLALGLVFDQAGGTWRGLLAVAYPITDIAILGLAGGILLRGRAAFRSALGLAYVAFLLIAVADFGLATGVFNDTYATGQFADAGWIAGFLVLAAATRAPAPPRVDPWNPYGQRIGHLLPIAAMAAAAMAFALALWMQELDDMPWRIAMGALVLAALARQFLTENEYRALVREREQAQASYHSLVENAMEGIFRNGLDGRILFANPAAARLLGYDSPAQLLSEVPNAAALYRDPADRPRFLAAMRAPAPIPFEVELLRRDGSPLWAALHAHFVRDSNGVEVLEGLMEDRTAARAERLATAHLAAIVQSSDEAILSKDLQGRVQSWNPGAERLYGWSAAEAVGRPLTDLIVPPELAAAERRILEQVAAGKSVPRHDTVRRHKDGRRLEISLAVSPVFDASGAVVGASATAHDIAERKRAEEAQKALDAQNQELKRLEELSRLRMEFLNTAAYDLNTPLTPLKLQLAVFRHKGELNEQQQASLVMLERNVNRFQVLVQDMLDAARLQSGRLKLNLGPTALDHLVTETAAAFEEPARQAQIRLQVAPLPTVQVQADGSKLQQVLYNLMSNAVKYTPAGGRVEVRLTATPKEAVVTFKDTGLGMTPEQLGRLFQPFVRLHETVAGVAKGTGLGLYICKGLVEQHGGRIWADSEGPGKGSTFSVALPFPAPAPAA